LNYILNLAVKGERNPARLFDGALTQRYRTTFEQDSHSKEDEECDRLEQALEEGLQETFPASARTCRLLELRYK
jgi:hypothetical protein